MDSMNNYAESLFSAMFPLNEDNCDAEYNVFCGPNGSQKHMRTEDGVLVRKVFVSNIPQATTHDDIYNIFKSFGKVTDIIIKQSRREQNKKGVTFAFVTFATPESAYTAIQANSIFLEKKRLRVKPADTWHQPTDSKINKEHINPLNEGTDVDDESLLGAVGGIKIGNAAATKSSDLLSKVDKCYIDVLNDDCLLHLFSYFTKFELTKLEQVCQRWKGIAAVFWTRVRILDLSELDSQFGKLTTDSLRRLLLKFGDGLRGLKITSLSDHRLNSRTHQIIAKHCSNVELLDLSGLTTKQNGIASLARSCRSLKVVCFTEGSGVPDNAYEMLFSRNPHLENVSIKRNFNITGKCLSQLTSNMKVLNLDHCNCLKLKDLKMGFEKMTALEELSLDSCVTLTTNTMNEIGRYLPNLKSLSLNNYYPLMHANSLRAIKNLKNLTKLYLSMNQAVQDEFFKEISTECLNLELLDISGCGSRSETMLTTVCFGHIAKLPKLCDLRLDYMDIVDDQSILCLAVKGILKVLTCRGCPFLNDIGVRSIMDLCPNLESIDLSGCGFVTNETITNAVKILKTQEKRTKELILTVGGSSVNLDSLEDEEEEYTHPLLQVVDKNNSLLHLMPDFYDDYFPDSDDDFDDIANMDYDQDDYDIEDFLGLNGYFDEGDDILYMRALLEGDHDLLNMF